MTMNIRFAFFAALALVAIAAGVKLYSTGKADGVSETTNLWQAEKTEMLSVANQQLEEALNKQQQLQKQLSINAQENKRELKNITTRYNVIITTLTTRRPRALPNSTAPAARANRVSSLPRPTFLPG